MTLIKRSLFTLLLLATLSFCRQREKAISDDNGAKEAFVKYAKGLEINQYDTWTEVIVKQPWQGAEKPIKYALVPKGSAADIPGGEYVVVHVPLGKVAATSTTHLPHFIALGETDKLKGFANATYIYSDFFRQRIENGAIQEIGDGAGLNFESCLGLQPDALFTFSMGNNRRADQQLEAAGIPILYNADYLEATPLGRAEWLKFTAAFFNRRKEADSVFSAIERNYLSLKETAKNAAPKPSVLTGVVYGETWFLPGGKNYGATFFEDAGGRYVWSDNPDNGWLELSFEAVYEKGAYTDFWIGVASFGSLDQMAGQESRYQLFLPWKNKQVFNYDNQVTETGSNNYLEEGYSRPDLILADLVFILHPELLPQHEFYFYRKLP